MKKIIIFLNIIIITITLKAQNFYEKYDTYYNKYVNAIGVNQRIAQQFKPQVIKLANYLLLYQGYICTGNIDSASVIREKIINLLKADENLRIGIFGTGETGWAQGNFGSIQINKDGEFGYDDNFTYYKNDSLKAGRIVNTKKAYSLEEYFTGISLSVYLNLLKLNSINTKRANIDTLFFYGSTTSITDGDTLATKQYFDSVNNILIRVVDVDKLITDTLVMKNKKYKTSTTGSTILSKLYIDNVLNSIANNFTTNNISMSNFKFKNRNIISVTDGSTLVTDDYISALSDIISGDTIKYKYFLHTTDGRYLLNVSSYFEGKKIDGTPSIIFKTMDGNMMIICSNEAIVENIMFDASGISSLSNSYIYGISEDSISFIYIDESLLSLQGNKIKTYATLSLNGGKTGIVSESDDIANKGYANSKIVSNYIPQSFEIDYPTMTSDNLPEGNNNLYISGNTINNLIGDYNVPLTYNDDTLRIDSSFSIKGNTTIGKYVNSFRMVYPYQDSISKTLFLKPEHAGLGVDYFIDVDDGNVGYIDSAFSFATGSNNTIYGITKDYDNDGYFLVGNFTTYKGDNFNRMVKINESGLKSTEFVSSGGLANFSIYGCEVFKNGEVLVYGSFTTFNGAPRYSLNILNNNGTNASWIDGGFNGDVNDAIIYRDSLIIAVGDFNSFNTNPCSYGIVRINRTTKTIDNTFLTGDGFTSGFTPLCITNYNNNYLLLGGDFEEYKDTTVNSLFMINNNGSINTSFKTNSGTGANGYVNSISVIQDKIYITGNFISYNSNSCKYIARINIDGSYDNTFSVRNGFDGVPNKVISYRDKLLIVGNFTKYNDTTSKYAIILDYNGYIYSRFIFNDNFNGVINDAYVDNNGEIIFVGDFIKYSNTDCGRIVKLKNHEDYIMEVVSDKQRWYYNLIYK